MSDSSSPCSASRASRVGQRRGRPAVEEREAVVRVDEVHADRVRPAAEVEVEEAQRIHNRIFAVAVLAFARVKWVIGLVALAVLDPRRAAQGTRGSPIDEGDPVLLPGTRRPAAPGVAAAALVVRRRLDPARSSRRTAAGSSAARQRALLGQPAG